MKQSSRAAVALPLALLLVCAFPAPPLRAQEPGLLAAAEVRDDAAPARIGAARHGDQIPRHIVPVRVTETAEGSRVTLASDASLDDYAARLEGGKFYVLIRRADASKVTPNVFRGRGFASARLEQTGDDVLLTFELKEGVTPRVTRKFNRLEIDFAVQDGGQVQLEQLLRRVEQLEGEVKDLRSQVAVLRVPTAVPAPATETADAAAAQEEEQAHGAVGPSHETHTTGPRLQIQGFADINFRAGNGRGTTNAFGLGQLDLFITSQLSEKFSVVSELILEAKRDNSFEFEIHRLLLRYAMNDYLTLSAGRYHTNIGFYNTAFHHGSYFATAANRPFLFAFESGGGVLPLHNTGLSVTGRVPSGSLGLRYVAEIGNGRSARSPVDRTVQTSFDENNGKAFNLGLFARPDWLPGLQTGFSFYRDRLTPTAAPSVDQRIMAAHAVYSGPRFEWLNEAVFVRHAPEGSGGLAFYTPGFYTQFGRRFGKAMPYARYQYINAHERDPIYRDVGRRNGPSFGLRYDLTEYAAFKAQYDRTARRRQTTLDELILQLAFTF